MGIDKGTERYWAWQRRRGLRYAAWVSLTLLFMAVLIGFVPGKWFVAASGLLLPVGVVMIVRAAGKARGREAQLYGLGQTSLGKRPDIHEFG
ncbi:MAG: hypothetical protein MRY63_03435 [Neomegalonema sp.]|nr:hypothetical protein [Neomegalonema sp.]